jgi:hypothetical protein
MEPDLPSNSAVLPPPHERLAKGRVKLYPSRPTTGYERFLYYAIIAGLILVVIACVYLSQDYYEDHRYNIGVIKFTAKSTHGLGLLTSLTALFFEKYSIIHSEDWHRGLSILMAAEAYRLVPSDITLRTIHLLYVVVFGVSLYIIVKRCISEMERKAGVDYPLLPIVTILTFAATPIAVKAMARYALDDLPANMFGLIAIGVLVWRQAPSVKSIILSGVLLGFAVWMKDLFLLWIPIMALLLCIVLGIGAKQGILTIASKAIILLAAAGLVVATKICWNIYDYGALLPEASQIHNRLYNFGHYTHLDPHYPFYLFSDDRYKSTIGASGGYLLAIKSLLLRDLPELVVLVRSSKYLCIVALGCILVPGSAWPDLSRFQGRIILAALLHFLLLAMFLLFGGGEIQQYRYLIAPIGLLYGACFPLLIVHTFPIARTSRLGPIFYMTPLLLLLETGTARLFLGSPPLAATTATAISELKIDTSRTMMFDVQRAMYYYSFVPQPLIGITMAIFLDLPAADAARWVKDFNIGYAVLPQNDAPVAARLRSFGFRETNLPNDEILMTRIESDKP